MSKWIWWDMDGTIANLYSVEDWLPKLIAEDASPYLTAAPMVNMSVLARKIRFLQAKGYKVGIISWLSKNSTPEYDAKVTAAKLKWLSIHLKSVKWDAVNIMAYGTNKWMVCREGILFDDEKPNRDAWGGAAYHPENMMNVLSNLTV